MKLFQNLTAVVAATAALAAASPAMAEIEEVTLKLQDYSPPSGARYEAIKWWMDEVTERSGGKITFQPFFGGSLVPSNEALSALSTGLADVGMVNAGLHPAQLPLHTAGSVPFGAGSFEQAANAWMTLYDEFPAMREELESQGLVPLAIQGTPSMQLRLNEPLEGLEDLQGRKIRTFGESATAVENWGAVPVSMPFPEIYEALRLGTIDGTIDYLYTVENYRLHEVGPYFVLGNFGALPTQPFLINKETWDSLGPEAQQILAETARESIDVLVEKFDEADKAAMEIMKEAGNEIITLSSEQRRDWFEKAGAEAIWDAWAADVDEQGIPGSEIANRYLELSAQ